MLFAPFSMPLALFFYAIVTFRSKCYPGNRQILSQVLHLGKKIKTSSLQQELALTIFSYFFAVLVQVTYRDWVVKINIPKASRITKIISDSEADNGSIGGKITIRLSAKLTREISMAAVIKIMLLTLFFASFLR